MTALFNTFVVLFVVLDPIGVAALFAILTPELAARERRRIALKAVALASMILLVFFVGGDALLGALGVSVPAFRIAGGVLLFMLAIDMVFARQSGLRSTTQGEQREARHKQDITVFPLAFPLIAGPGALTSVLLMASNWKEAWMFGAMLAVLLSVLLLTLLALLMSPFILRGLGETGVNVISRLFGLILAAMAVQFVIDGLRASFA